MYVGKNSTVREPMEISPCQALGLFKVCLLRLHYFGSDKLQCAREGFDQRMVS